MEKTLNKYFESDFMKLIKEKIIEFKSKIANELNKKNGPSDPAIIGEMRNALQQTINDFVDLERKKNPRGDLIFKEEVQRLEQAQNLLAVGNEMDDDFYDDEAKVRACAVALTRGSKNNVKILETLEQNLGKVLIERVYDIRKSIYEMIQNLATPKPHTELDISKWQVQCLLRDAKDVFHKMTSGFEMGRDLQLSVDKLNEGMSTLIGVYDRIDSYTEKQDLAHYIANVSTSHLKAIKNAFSRGLGILNVGSTNPAKADDCVRKLKEMIKINILLEEYEIALNAFKQYKFPFAPIYMEKVELPEALQIHDIDGLKNQAKSKIKLMRDAIQSSDILIGKYDQDIINVNPLQFYTWKHGEFKDDICKLLSGEEITLNADIAKGLNQNAVKFKEIGIHFKLASEELQHELDAKLKRYVVYMTMVGNSYYRCGKRSYSMSIDENIVISYSLKKNKNGEPKSMNDVHRKIVGGRYFLSPYTVWSIKLSGESFGELDKFKNEAIDLQLIGNGQYVKNSSSITNEIPCSILDKHYNFDSVIEFSNSNTLIESI